jgi:hypothetical protein
MPVLYKVLGPGALATDPEVSMIPVVIPKESLGSSKNPEA